jgi:transposase
LRSIQALERELASLLVRTPYVLLLSFPGINVVSAAEFAGEMGPITNSPSDSAITGRAGLYPSRYQSDEVDHTGPLVSRANRALRYVLLLIAENLLKCNDHFHGLGEAWRTAGVGWRAQVVRAAKRFCRIAYRMVAGRQVFSHPSCRQRHYILEKLTTFYCEHETSLEQVLRDLRAAVDWVPQAEHAAEAKRLQASVPSAAAAQAAAASAQPRRAARPPSPSGRRTGPRPLSAILPEV